MADYWTELLARVQYLRDLYHDKKISLKPGQGLTQALDEAEACARCAPSPDAPTDDNLVNSVNACHLVWGLHDSVKACSDATLDVASHLRRLTTGTIDFGVPADPVTAARTIYFKDFEAELFVAGQLAKGGLHVEFLPQDNDPRGEMSVEGIFIEVKHPNSTRRLESLMRKFNGELRKGSAYGVFVTAVEDAFHMAEQSASASQGDHLAWQRQKRGEMELFGWNAVLRAASLPRIAALIQTCSVTEFAEGSAQFVRRGNSLVFDHRQYPPETLRCVERIAAVFNPRLPRYSLIRDLIAPPRRS